MSPSPLFLDRADAGTQLAQLVKRELTDQQLSTLKPIVYALPRGGLPIAVPVARLLGCPLNIIVAKKITRPENPELAIGAVTADGYVLWSQHTGTGRLNLQQRDVALRQAQEKAQAQLAKLAPQQLHINPQGRLALLVDDGIATGMTMMTAVQSLRAKAPAMIGICAPVAPPDLIEALYQWADRVIVLATPQPFLSVSRFYRDFPQVEMSEAIFCLQEHHAWLAAQPTTLLDLS